jgi:pimeloyl-ACP methyl ester carboxylesterase
VLRQGSGEPLVLLHGILCSERIWRNVVGLLSAQHDVIVPTMLGHNGGQLASHRPASIEHLVDDLERLLDELGLSKAHLAGNSLGGWAALELARRGRALTVCALSPAGAWGSETDAQPVRATLKRAVRDIQRSRRIVPLVAHSRYIRRFALRNSALHGERVSPVEFLSLTDDVIGCQISGDLLASDARLSPLDPAPCPITLAWSAEDRIFPLEAYRSHACELFPGADFIVLDDVGHIPMLDDPRLVAQTILSSTARITDTLNG